MTFPVNMKLEQNTQNRGTFLQSMCSFSPSHFFCLSFCFIYIFLSACYPSFLFSVSRSLLLLSVFHPACFPCSWLCYAYILLCSASLPSSLAYFVWKNLISSHSFVYIYFLSFLYFTLSLYLHFVFPLYILPPFCVSDIFIWLTIYILSVISL